MLVRTGGLSGFTNEFLPQKFDTVWPAVDGGSITQSASSGRDGRGGITFVTGADSDNLAYALYIQDAIPAADTQIFGIAIRQTTTQAALGGRLLTLVDGGEDVFGETTQVGINIMPDGTLQAVRANAQGSGIVLRGLTDASPQVTLLGTSTTAIDATDTEFVVIQVFHDSAVGSIDVTFYDDVGDVKGTWSLANVNTAVSGRNQSTSYCYGGYAFSDELFSARGHEDLQAVISDLYIVNNIVNPDDSRDPVTTLGNRVPVMVLPDAAGALSEWTPDPTQDNYLNVNEVPPDEDVTENSAATLADTDTMGMQDSATDDQEIVVAYSAFVVSDAPSSCVTGDPALFEAFVYTEQTDPGEVHTSGITGPPCNLSDYNSRRAQSVCTISQDGDSVTFKPLSLGPPLDAYYIGLSPLNAPPRLQIPDGPDQFVSTVFTNPFNMSVGSSETNYLLPFFQPWYGSAFAANLQMTTAGDFMQFELAHPGIGIDVGMCDSAVTPGTFNPYTSPLGAFHFREDIIGSPYFWVSQSFAYGGETIYSYIEGDSFKVVRNDPNVEFWQNGALLETINTGGMPANVQPYVFAGRWGWDNAAIPPGYTLRPGIKQAFSQIGGSDCVRALYDYDMLSTSWGPSAVELQQWGISINADFPDGFVFDPGGTHGPYPQFGLTSDTFFIFRLDSGNIVLEIHNYDFLVGISDVGGHGEWTYTIPYANTDDFVLGTVYNVGVPVFPATALEYAFPTPGANAPLRLVFLPIYDNGGGVGGTRGIVNVVFTFATAGGPASFGGVMRQSGNNRLGTSAEAPTTEYRYKQSFLGSTPSDAAITVADFDGSEHGYEKVDE